MRYYVYSDLVNRYSKVHSDRCANYRSRKPTMVTDNEWHGPYEHIAVAMVAGVVHFPETKQVSYCQSCT